MVAFTTGVAFIIKEKADIGLVSVIWAVFGTVFGNAFLYAGNFVFAIKFGGTIALLIAECKDLSIQFEDIQSCPESGKFLNLCFATDCPGQIGINR